MSEGLKQKLLDLKRFRVLTNEESSVTKGEKITRKDYVETVKLPDVVALLNEVAKPFPCLECHNWKDGKCDDRKGFDCSHQEYAGWFLAFWEGEKK